MNKYIIGMGNYAKQDDGIGLRVVEYIIDNNLDDGFIAIEAGNDGLSVMGYFSEDTERILIVDCALVGLEPGESMILDVEDVDSKKLVGTISTHEGDILRIVELARGLGYAVPSVMVLAIQPESMEMEMSLTQTLEKKLEEYVKIAITEISS